MIFLTDPHSFNYYYSEDIREIIFHKNSSLLRLLKIIGIFYKPLSYFICWISLFYILFKKKVSVVHFQWLSLYEKVNIELLLIKILRNYDVKIIYTVHNVVPHNSKNQIDRYLKLYNQFDYLICHNEATKMEIEEKIHDSTKIKVIPHGIFTTNSNSNSVNTEKKLLLYGFISEYKGFDLLIKASSQILEHSLKIKVIGKIEKKYFKEIESDLSKSSIECLFDYISSDKLDDYIMESDILVFPYKKISQSGALLKALGTGKIVVCSDLPAFRELMGDNGLYFNLKDNEGLSKLLKYVLDNFDELKQRFEEASKKYLEQFSWEKVAQTTYNLYKL
ncbi:MAG: glycosyltransferase [Bacteroidetes bacterium]|nr:glycosyltransferase [Bacteroidota bacterium]